MTWSNLEAAQTPKPPPPQTPKPPPPPPGKSAAAKVLHRKPHRVVASA